MLLLILAIIPLNSSVRAGIDDWTIQSPLPHGYDIYNVFCLDSSHVWAVGERETVVFFNGSSWTLQNKGSGIDLYDVHACDPSHVWAVGEGGKILFFDGSSWSEQESGTSETLCAVSALDSTHVWAAGDEGKVLFFNGSSWQSQAVGTSSVFKSVFTLDSSHVWAGTNGRLYFFDGSSWSSQSTGSGYIVDIKALSPSEVWLTCSSGQIIFHDGSSFTTVVSGGLESSLTDASFLDSTHIWGVDYEGQVLFCEGSTWSIQAVHPTRDMKGVYALSTSCVWVVGEGGELFLGNGISWTPYLKGTAHDLNDVTAVDKNHAWAVGEYGTIVFYNGSSWRPQDSGITKPLYGVSASDSNHIWAVGHGGTILYSNGASWTPQASGTTSCLYGVSAVDSNHVWAVGEENTLLFYNGSSWKQQDLPEKNTTRRFTSISACDSSHVWALEDMGSFYFYDGKSWSIQRPGTAMSSDGDCYSIFAIDPSHVWAVGDQPLSTSKCDVLDKCMIYFFDGTSWDKITGLDWIFSTIHDISAFDPSHLWAVRGDVMYFDGLNWDLYDDVPPLSDVCTADPSSIWYVGPDGSIIYQEIKFISSSNPNAAVPGQTLDIELKGSGTSFKKGVSKASFSPKGIKVNSTRVLNSNSAIVNITVDSNASPGVYSATINTPGETTEPLAKGLTVYSPGTLATPVWYLAEGCSDYGFDTYVTIENPNSTDVTALITYMTKDGPKTREPIPLPARSQTTINPRNDLGSTDFSTKVECKEDKKISVDRRMIWTGGGTTAQEGHCSIGVNSPSKIWYLPEGSSKWGFETWLLVQNPNPVEATCYVTYMTEDEGPKVLEKRIPANSRASYSMADDIGAHDSSIKVESEIGLIAERAMYRNNRREGHGSIGTTAPSCTYYLAEGAIGYSSNFINYILVQNPQNEEVEVTLQYRTDDFIPEKDGPTCTMPPNSRKTFRVNDDFNEGASYSVSTYVEADKPIIAERAMYWNSPTGEVCHDSIGVDQPHKTFYLPDGETYNGRETWTLVSNPNAKAVEITISYLTPDGKSNVAFKDEVPGESRKTYFMADALPNNRAAIIVNCESSDKKILVERAMYWDSRGAGTCSIGGYSD